jgi:hypothetical protein
LAAYEKWGEKCPEKLRGLLFRNMGQRRQRIYCPGSCRRETLLLPPAR